MSDLTRLRQLLTAYFNESELRTLAFDLGLDYELLPGATRGDKARELVAHLWRTDRLGELIYMGREARPNADWPDGTAVPPPGDPPRTGPRSVGPPVSGAPPALLHDPAANPFTYGNPISDPNRFFGRAREIEQVFNRLRNAEGESSSIVGGRRIGKSSLLNYLAHPDVHKRFGFNPERSIFVYVDLQIVDQQTTPARLWQRLLSRMGRHNTGEELSRKVSEIIDGGTFDNFTLTDLFDLVDRQHRHIVFLLDEFENVTTNPNFDPGFFYGLRSLAIQHNLSLVTSSRHELIDLTHSQEVRSSPFFNIFANINIRLFTAAETGKLVAGLLSGTHIEFSEEDTATLVEIAGGHPFFLQAAGYFLVAASGEYADAGKRRAAWLSAFRSEAGPHLAHYWHTSDINERAALATLALLSRRATGRPFLDARELEAHFPRAGQILPMLVRQGYVAEDGGRYAIFSRVFADWIAAELRAGDHATVESAPAESVGTGPAKLPANRRKALALLAGHIAPAYQPLLIILLEKCNDPDLTARLVIEGLAG